jgi:hypothetical protein
MESQDKKSINIEDLDVKQSLETIWNMMNKAASKGVFNIDESYILKVLFSKVSKSITEDTSKSITYKTSNNV